MSLVPRGSQLVECHLVLVARRCCHLTLMALVNMMDDSETA